MRTNKHAIMEERFEPLTFRYESSTLTGSTLYVHEEFSTLIHHEN